MFHRINDPLDLFGDRFSLQEKGFRAVGGTREHGVGLSRGWDGVGGVACDRLRVAALSSDCAVCVAVGWACG